MDKIKNNYSELQKSEAKIAEFMNCNLIHFKSDIDGTDKYYWENDEKCIIKCGETPPCYSSDWNLLMTAVAKLETMRYMINISCLGTQIQDRKTRTLIWDDDFEDFYDDEMKLYSTYKAVVYLIERENEK